MKACSDSRRSFLKRTSRSLAALAVFPSIVPAAALGRSGSVAANDRITLGFIGTGDHGTNYNLRSFLQNADARAVAVCDVDRKRRERAADLINAHYGSSDCALYGDFRELLERPEIDAVMISTPDHWHVPIAVAALKAGKDVCCEKPTLTVREGRWLCETVERYQKVFQWSTEDRSVYQYHRMSELVRNGRIGQLESIVVRLWSGPYNVVADRRIQPVPEGFDYDMWLGPAPEAPYCPARCHFHFRWISDYSGGMLTDWGAHLLDTAQWGNDSENTGPVEVEGSGVFPLDDLYDTAVEYRLEYLYANGVKLTIQSGGCGIRFEGTEGWIGNSGWRGPLEASDPAILRSHIGPADKHLYTCVQGEHRNFLDCVRTRRQPYFPAEVGQRCFTILHLGNIAMRRGGRLAWDPRTERFPDDPVANRMLSRSMRQLPGLTYEL